MFHADFCIVHTGQTNIEPLKSQGFQASQRYPTRRHPSPLPDCPRMLPKKSNEAYLVRAPKARLYRKVLVAKCFEGCAEGPYQGKALSL